MMMMARLVSEWFMLVLSLLAAPVDQKEIRIDVLQSAGRIETVIAKRTDDGFTLQIQRGDALVDMATVKAVAGKNLVFTLKPREEGVPEQTVDILAAIPDLKPDDLRKSARLELKATDNTPVSVRRSGNVVYLTPGNAPVTYACH